MNPTLQTSSNSRLWHLDLLRILAAFGVVVLHTTPLPDVLGGVNSAQWQTAVSFSILFRWCVPVFFMISGALFLAPDRAFSTRRLYRKSISRIAFSFLFWSAVYAVVHCLRTGKGKWTFLNQLLRGHFHMWYLFALLGLYMLTPLLREMTKNKKMTGYFVLLGLVFTFFMPRFFSVLFLFPLPHDDVFASLRSAVTQLNPLGGIYPVYYFVLGHYLCTCALKKTQRCLLYVSGIAGCLLSMGLTVWHSVSLQEISGQFYDISSLGALFMAAAVFVFFRQHFSDFHPNARAVRIVTKLSACSFGIYLLHPLVLDLLKPALPQLPLMIPFAIAAWALIVCLILIPVCLFIRHIPPLGKNFL